MMGMLWVVLFLALTGSQAGFGLPLKPTPQVHPQETSGPSLFAAWGTESGLYAAVPAVALVITAVGLLFGCTWCYRHKDCKLFTASATHLHEARRSHPPDSGFSEPINNNISEDNNNGPISLREMQNIANNNATAYIVSENEERNRVSRESVVEFEPLPSGIRVADPLEHCVDWFGGEDLQRNKLQYLREIGRGWFGRVVEGELEENGTTTTVAVKILNQNATLEDKARFLDEARMYRDVSHENILAFVTKCLQEDPWILLFELCSMDLQQYLTVNRPKMAILNESGVPLQLMCDVSSALSYLHSRGYLYGSLWSGNVLVRGNAESARAVLGQYANAEPQHELAAPETRRHPAVHTASSEVWSLGVVVWEVCAWGSIPPHHPPPVPDLPCPYRSHLYQVMQLCWNSNPEARPTSAQVHALINHLHTTHAHSTGSQDDGYGSSDFEERWQRLKPNTIPKIDEHVAIVHAPSTSMTSHFTGSDQEFDNVQTIQDTLSVDMDTAVSRSSSIMSDKDPLSVQIKSESLTNLHGSLEDVRNIYLTHNETAVLECHQANIGLDDSRDKEHDRSDSSVDPWLKDIIAGSQDDVSYYRDVSDVIKNLDNILNSEKTSSSESSHQASPSRDNLSLDCKKDYPIQSCMVKSPGISNFQNILEMGFEAKTEENETCEEDDIDRDTIGTLSHSFERHSDTTSQHTLENLTPETPIRDLEVVCKAESKFEELFKTDLEKDDVVNKDGDIKLLHQETELPKECNVESSNNKLPTLKELCVASIPSVSDKFEQLNVREDCQTPCDNNLTKIVRTDINKTETKSIGDKTHEKSQDHSTFDSAPFLEEVTVTVPVQNTEQIDSVIEKNVDDIISAETVTEITSEKKNLDLPNVIAQTDVFLHSERVLSSQVDNYSKATKTVSDIKDEVSELKKESKIADNVSMKEIESDNIIINNKIETSDIISPAIITTGLTHEPREEINVLKDDNVAENTEKIESIDTSPLRTPEPVQSKLDEVSIETTCDLEEIKESEIKPTIVSNEEKTFVPMSPETVQNDDKVISSLCEMKEEKLESVTERATEAKDDNITSRSDKSNDTIQETVAKQHYDSTVYMDLTNNTNNVILKDTLDDKVQDVINSCLQSSSVTDSVCSVLKNESTVYLDLPKVIKQTGIFLHSERVLNSQVDFKDIISTSTPKSDSSEQNTLENSKKENENEVLSETKIPDYGPGVTLTKLEQRSVPDNMSPFESPTKSHHTDTYEENSSVVLGPFENCTIELFKGVKSNTEQVELPKEELLAFSSNFSEINLETPSPLRDGNFLNEVPDIVHDDLHFDDIETISEAKAETKSEPQTENTSEGQSSTEKHISPSTPPNSPGNFLASTSQQKYLVEIDLNPPNEPAPVEPDSGLSSLQKEIDLNQIELQITTKLAMAENENNMNIEYSGPLTVEGLVLEESVLTRDSDAIPESYLAGNGGSVESLREVFTLDEECVKALRNELELKLPLAQVASIEPQCENEWSTELPPPPELVVSYPGALSPIQEETGQQLSAYENDTNWNTSTRTDSSESYPEPCNNSTDDVTDLPTGVHGSHHDRGHDRDHDHDYDREHDHSTYTIHSRDASLDRTYTVHKDVNSSKEITMSADSLNASPCKKPKDETKSPINDSTYNKGDDEKESNCERISQVSPFLLSPTTDTSDNVDNVTGVSTLSRTTVPTDAKLSKPSETQCLSKATSIDSWCSNDTLYNVEENFDDLAMDPDLPQDFEPEKEDDNSESSHTLTHNDDEKELSHCSTYIIHDSKSEVCETISPDSITANDNNTYTKVKTEAAGTSPSVITKSDVNDSTKNTQTKDLAYGTLMSGVPSYSNCTTEVMSAAEDMWKLPQPELIRRSPMGDEIHLTPPKLAEQMDNDVKDSPILTSEPSVKKMDSVEISCLQDVLWNSPPKSENSDAQVLSPTETNDSPNFYYKNMVASGTSTPFIEPCADNENVEPIPMQLPEINTESPDCIINNVPNFQTFLYSAELRPQDISPNGSNETPSANQDTGIGRSCRDSLLNSDCTPSYLAFEMSAANKPQDEYISEKSSQSSESGITAEEFRQFVNSIKSRPQDLSSFIDASYLLLRSERRSSELSMGNLTNVNPDQASQGNRVKNSEPTPILVLSPPNITNLKESHCVVSISEPIFVTDLDGEEETEQPHSIIITESPKNISKENVNRTYDSHTGMKLDLNHTYDSHSSRSQAVDDAKKIDSVESNQSKVNGVDDAHEEAQVSEEKPSKVETTHDLIEDLSESQKDISNGPLSEDLCKSMDEITCNGNAEKYAVINFVNETFEELIESNVDDNDSKDTKIDEPSQKEPEKSPESVVPTEKFKTLEAPKNLAHNVLEDTKREVNGVDEGKLSDVTANFLQNEKKFCQLDCYLPLLSDIRFTGPAAEIMSTSFTQDSPTEPTAPECDKSEENKPDTAADILKEWDSDSDSHTSNSSSGEFIWKDGDGHETSVVPSTQFDHQRGSGSQPGESGERGAGDGDGGASDGSGDSGSGSGSGSEGDEVEFVPSSWDCRAAPAKSSLRSLEQAPPDNKKRVVFKRQKYHCVYEYPREVADVDTDSPAGYLPDFSTYSEWDPTSVEEAELGYGQLFGGPNPLDLFPLRAGIAFGADYDEDFFISSSARPFESLGIMSTTSQFFPGMHVKPSALLDRELADDISEDFPPPPSPLPTATLVQTRTPSLDFTTPDSGVEDITPGSTTAEEDYKPKLPESGVTQCWRPVDSGSSSESVSPSSPGGEALGGLRHTRDKLKLDLPPSPHIPSPRHNRVFNFVLDKPKRSRPVQDERPIETGTTPLVMTDETPIITTSLPLQKECEDVPVPEPTFSTFGKSVQRNVSHEEKSIVLTDEVRENESEVTEEVQQEGSSHVKAAEAVRGEGTLLDSGDEDSGIESSSKATLERNQPTPTSLK